MPVDPALQAAQDYYYKNFFLPMGYEAGKKAWLEYGEKEFFAKYPQYADKSGYANASRDDIIAMGVENVRPSNDPNFAYYQQRFQDEFNKPDRANPYDMGRARASRAGQEQLYALMQQQQAPGNSISRLQGIGALGKNATAALGAMSRGPLGGRAALGQQAGIGSDISQKVAAARLQEGLGANKGLFGLASQMRGGDIQAAGDSSKIGIGVRDLDTTRRLTAAKGGMSMDAAARDRELEKQRLIGLIKRGGDEAEESFRNGLLQAGATGLSILL